MVRLLMTNGLNLKRFVAYYLGLSIGIPILKAVINRLTGMDLTSSATGIIPIMVAALDQGMQYGTRHETPATNREMWRYAVILGGLGVVMSGLIAGAVVLLMPGLRDLYLTLVGGATLAVATVICLILFPPLARWFFGQGMRNAHKLQAKKKAKSPE